MFVLADYLLGIVVFVGLLLYFPMRARMKHMVSELGEMKKTVAELVAAQKNKNSTPRPVRIPGRGAIES